MADLEEPTKPPVCAVNQLGDGHTPYSSLGLCTLDFKKTRIALNSVSAMEGWKFLWEVALT